jgi:sRNA-binding carbon storage regulator CsrA
VLVVRQELFQQVQSANSAAAASVRPSTNRVAALLRGQRGASAE